MTKHFKNTIKNILSRRVLPISICAIALVAFLAGVTKAGNFSNAQNLEVLEQSINEAIVCCYSIEGKYPPNLEYLEKNYNLYINHDKYLVDYDIFASNIMPDVIVIDKTVFG
ncbi:MAG: hypothetical protein RR048_04075 [Oscillospiraceae bacterium]